MPDFVPVPRAAATTITGERGPEDVDSKQVVADVEDEIFMYQPKANAFGTITKLRKTRMATQYRFDIIEEDEYPRELTLSAASIVGDTTLDVQAGQGNNVAKNMVLLNTRTRERVHVGSVASDVITVTRGKGTNQVDMAIGDKLVICSNVFEDGEDKGPLKSVKAANVFNLCQINRTIYGVTGRQEFTKLYGGRDLNHLRKKMGIEHAKSLETEFFFGRRLEEDGVDHKRTFTGGLEHFISSNVWDVTGIALTERAFVDFLEEAMRWGQGGYQNGSSTKYLYHSARWATEIEFWAKDKIRYDPDDQVAGLRIGRYRTTHGDVMLVPAAILNYAHQDMAFLCDMNHIRYVYHEGRDTKILRDRQGNGVDGKEEEIMTDFGLEVQLEATHALLKGLS